MELINREKNYNKLFNATPLIGVIDPLHVKKQQRHGSNSSSTYSSTPSLISVEDSLPSMVGGSSSRLVGSSPLIRATTKDKTIHDNKGINNEIIFGISFNDRPTSRTS